MQAFRLAHRSCAEAHCCRFNAPSRRQAAHVSLCHAQPVNSIGSLTSGESSTLRNTLPAKDKLALINRAKERRLEALQQDASNPYKSGAPGIVDVRLYHSAVESQKRLSAKLSEANAHAAHLERRLEAADEDLRLAAAFLLKLFRELGSTTRLAESAAAAFRFGADPGDAAARLERLGERLARAEAALQSHRASFSRRVPQLVPLTWVGPASEVRLMGDFDGWTRGCSLSAEDSSAGAAPASASLSAASAPAAPAFYSHALSGSGSSPASAPPPSSMPAAAAAAVAVGTVPSAPPPSPQQQQPSRNNPTTTTTSSSSSSSSPPPPPSPFSSAASSSPATALPPLPPSSSSSASASQLHSSPSTSTATLDPSRNHTTTTTSAPAGAPPTATTATTTTTTAAASPSSNKATSPPSTQPDARTGHAATNGAVTTVKAAEGALSNAQAQLQAQAEASDGVLRRFVGRVALLPGRYAVKFLVDGQWRLAAEWPMEQNELGETNNVLIVQ